MPKFTCRHCGCENDLNLRSREAHNAFFAFLQYCVGCWPSELEFQPANKDELRAWAMLETNHRQPPFVHQFENEVQKDAAMPLIMAQIHYNKRRGIYSRAVQVDGGISIIEPKSFSWDAVPLQQEASEIADDVTACIQAYAGIDFKKWIEMGSPRRFRDVA